MLQLFVANWPISGQVIESIETIYPKKKKKHTHGAGMLFGESTRWCQNNKGEGAF